MCLCCEGDGNAGVGSGGGVVAVSAYMSGTRGSGVLSSAGDVLEMSVVRGVGGVCDMCKCFARGGVGGVGGEWVTGLGLGFTNSGGTRRQSGGHSRVQAQGTIEKSKHPALQPSTTGSTPMLRGRFIV